MNTDKHRSEARIQHSALSIQHFSVSLRLGGFLLLLTAFCLVPTVASQTRDFTRHVNPFIGTGGHGHTFPGATMPFGMVQLSPDTRIDDWDGSSGYHYSDDIIYGFSHTHLSGTGIPDGCDILFMPTVKPALVEGHRGKAFRGYPSKFQHANERAEPGYYSVRLDETNVAAELTATDRVGFHRYTFPKSERAIVFLDLVWRDKLLDGSIRNVNSTTIEGHRRSSSWAKNQIVYFVAEFSRPYQGAQMSGNTKSPEPDYFRGEYDFGINFAHQPILLKVAISYVSIEGARKNLEAELPHWDFDKVRADARAAWNKELRKIEVSGGTPDQTTTFYTALYHTMIHPNVFNDVDGRYKGHDGKVHQLPDYERVSSPHVSKGSTSGTIQLRTTTPSAETTATPPKQVGELKRTNPKSKIQNPKSGDHYTVFSLWDTFRAAHPLYTIIDQKRTVDFINTFIRIYE